MRGEGALTVISGSCYGDRSPTFRFRIVLRQLVKEHEESTVQLYIWTLYTWGKKNTNVKPSNQIRQVSRGKNIYIFKEESLSSICHLELHTMVNKMLSMWMMPLSLISVAWLCWRQSTCKQPHEAVFFKESKKGRQGKNRIRRQETQGHNAGHWDNLTARPGTAADTEPVPGHARMLVCHNSNT